MTSRDAAAASEVILCNQDARHEGTTVVCRAILMVLSAVVLLLSMVSVAGASSSFYWYGENNSTCWQTGQPGASSSTCDGVGEWFLNSSPPVRTLEGALDGDLGLTQSGDYCNAYNLNEGPFYTRDTSNESGLTGFNPSPSDTMTDGHGDVCQALGEKWGQGLRPTVAAYCAPCGMQHYVSFASQDGALRPWSRAFGGPALVIEAAAYPQVVKASYAWGYLCPLFEQVGSAHGNLLEYCFVEWTKGWGLPFEGQVVGSADADGHNMNEIRTDFALGTNFSAEIAGSANSYVIGEHPWIGPFKAAIREENLLAAIKDANATYGTGFSESPSEYALIGVEQGTEELGAEELGENTGNLKLYTEYTPLPPEATTGAATEVQQFQTKLNGTVNPRGTDTHYHFQYGTTTAYGSSTASTDAGSGMSAAPESATITGLEPGTTYHYRIVATSTGGESKGSDQTFTTSGSIAPAAIREPAHGMQWVYYPTNASNIEGLFWNSSAGTWSPFDQWPSAPAAAQGTSAAAVYEEGVGQQWVYYQTARGSIEGLYWDASAGKWEAFDQWPEAPAARPGTSPTVIREPGGAGQQWVYYQTAQGNIEGLYWDASAGKWFTFEPVPGAPGAAPGTSPTAVFASGGQMWVYYHTAQGNIEGLYWNAKGTWSAFDMWPEAPDAAPGTSPTVIREPSGPGQQWVYYQTTRGSIDGLYWDASAGKWFVFEPVPGALAAAQGTSPTAVFDSSIGQMWVYYHTAQGNIEGLYWNAKGTWSAFDMWPEAPAAALWSSPTVMRESGVGQQWVYYEAASGNIEGLYWDASAGKWEAFDQWSGAPPA